MDGHTKFEVAETLQKVGVAAFPSMLHEDLYSDLHLKERDFLEEVKDSGKGGGVFAPLEIFRYASEACSGSRNGTGQCPCL